MRLGCAGSCRGGTPALVGLGFGGDWGTVDSYSSGSQDETVSGRRAPTLLLFLQALGTKALGLGGKLGSSNAALGESRESKRKGSWGECRWKGGGNDS